MISIKQVFEASMYQKHFKEQLKAHGVKHPGELKGKEAKKAFFNKVDASWKGKKEAD